MGVDQGAAGQGAYWSGMRRAGVDAAVYCVPVLSWLWLGSVVSVYMFGAPVQWCTGVEERVESVSYVQQGCGRM